MVADWVKEMTESVLGKSSMEIGKVVTHPDGYKVIDGQYWGTYGLSNFWTWQRVNADGSLGKKESGYGW